MIIPGLEIPAFGQNISDQYLYLALLPPAHVPPELSSLSPFQVIETLAKLHMIMEYAPHGELFTKITSFGKLTESEAKTTFSQIVSAVSHMVSAFPTRSSHATYDCVTQG